MQNNYFAVLKYLSHCRAHSSSFNKHDHFWESWCRFNTAEFILTSCSALVTPRSSYTEVAPSVQTTTISTMSNADWNLTHWPRRATWKTYTVSPRCALHVQAIKKGKRNVPSVMEINWAHDDVSRGFDVTGYTEVHNWSFRHTVSAVKTLLIDLSEKTCEWIKKEKHVQNDATINGTALSMTPH